MYKKELKIQFKPTVLMNHVLILNLIVSMVRVIVLRATIFCSWGTKLFTVQKQVHKNKDKAESRLTENWRQNS